MTTTVIHKVMKFQHEQSKVSASNDFFRVLSQDADLIMDGDLLVVSFYVLGIRLVSVSFGNVPPPPPV